MQKVWGSPAGFELENQVWRLLQFVVVLMCENKMMSYTSELLGVDLNGLKVDTLDVKMSGIQRGRCGVMMRPVVALLETHQHYTTWYIAGVVKPFKHQLHLIKINSGASMRRCEGCKGKTIAES